MNNDRRETQRDVMRRNILKWLGATSVGIVSGPASSQPSGSAPASEELNCTLTPKHIEGPYFVTENLKRSDIRIDTTDRTVRPGVPLAITLRVYGSLAGRCSPLAGAMVDIWHCDANGVYSDVVDPGYNTVGKNFLRGYQMTDANGEVSFNTIYPGRYPRRAPHIHVKVRQQRGHTARDFTETMRIVDAAGAPRIPGAGRPLFRQEFTTQLYLDPAISEAVYKNSPYDSTPPNEMTNARDLFFREGGGSRLILPLNRTGAGFSGAYRVALQLDEA